MSQLFTALWKAVLSDNIKRSSWDEFSLSLKGFQLRSEPFELKPNMHITLLFVFGLAIWQAESANIAIPNSQASCIAEVKFPVKVSMISLYIS